LGQKGLAAASPRDSGPNLTLGELEEFASRQPA
jgi:hypothetical protein